MSKLKKFTKEYLIDLFDGGINALSERRNMDYDDFRILEEILKTNRLNINIIKKESFNIKFYKIFLCIITGIGFLIFGILSYINIEYQIGLGLGFMIAVCEISFCYLLIKILWK